MWSKILLTNVVLRSIKIVHIIASERIFSEFVLSHFVNTRSPRTAWTFTKRWHRTPCPRRFVLKDMFIWRMWEHTVVIVREEAPNDWGSASKLCVMRSKIQDLERIFSPASAVFHLLLCFLSLCGWVHFYLACCLCSSHINCIAFTECLLVRCRERHCELLSVN